MLNKRGDLATTLLVFIVLVAIVGVIFGFLGFDSKIQEKVEKLSEPIGKVEFTQQYITKQAGYMGKESIAMGGDIKSNFIGLAAERNFGAESTGNFFRKIREGDFEFYLVDAEQGLYELQIKDIFIFSRVGTNEIERNFNLRIKVSAKDGDYFAETNVEPIAEDYPLDDITGEEFVLLMGKEQILLIGGEEHSLILLGFYEGGVLIRIQSEPMEIYLPARDSVSVDINKDGFYDSSIELVSFSPEREKAGIRFKKINEKVKAKDESIYFNLPDRTPPQSKIGDSPPSSSNDLLGVEELPERPAIPEVEYGSCRDDCPCGPTALYEAFQDLGREISPCEINEQRKGGFRRSFLSLFSSRAKDITWRGEIVKIAQNYGYEVEVIKGRKATLEMARKRSTSDSVVIMHTSIDSRWPQRYFTQHYETYDTEVIKEMKTHDPSRDKYDWSTDPLYGEELIHRLYVIKKPADSLGSV